MNPWPSATDRERRELTARVKNPVAGCRRIAVVSRKGGEVHYNLVCLDTGTGVLESASKRILQLVPQTAPWRHVAQKQLNSIVCVATGSWLWTPGACELAFSLSISRIIG